MRGEEDAGPPLWVTVTCASEGGSRADILGEPASTECVRVLAALLAAGERGLASPAEHPNGDTGSWLYLAAIGAAASCTCTNTHVIRRWFKCAPGEGVRTLGAQLALLERELVSLAEH